MEQIKNNPRGILLKENVDMNWLKKLEPRYHKDFIKFVVNTETNRVVVGMDVHKDAMVLLAENEDNLYGGNIYFDGHIIYESTLNIQKNLEIFENNKPKGILKIFNKNDSFKGNPRIITDKETIQMINSVLFSWVNIK